jgi:hypothetical protein
MERRFFVVQPANPLGAQRFSRQPSQNLPSGTSPATTERIASRNARRSRKRIAMRADPPRIRVHSGEKPVTLPKSRTSLMEPTAPGNQLKASW